MEKKILLSKYTKLICISVLFSFASHTIAKPFKNSYQKIKSNELNEFERLRKNHRYLGSSFKQTCCNMKKGRYPVDDIYLIEIYKNGARNYYEKAKMLRKQKLGSLSIKKKWKMRKLEKEAQKIEQKATKLLGRYSEQTDQDTQSIEQETVKLLALSQDSEID